MKENKYTPECNKGAIAISYTPHAYVFIFMHEGKLYAANEFKLKPLSMRKDTTSYN